MRDLKKYGQTINNIRKCGRYINTECKKVYITQGIAELAVPTLSVVSATAVSRVTDTITSRATQFSGLLVFGAFLILVCSFLSETGYGIISAFTEMSDMGIREKCKDDLLAALADKSMTEIEDADTLNKFSLLYSQAIWKVSGTGRILFSFLSGVFSIFSASVACAINHVAPIYFFVGALLYAAFLPLILHFEKQTRDCMNNSYKQTSGVDRRQGKIDALFTNKEAIFDITRRGIVPSLLKKYVSLGDGSLNAHIEADMLEYKYSNCISAVKIIYETIFYVALFLLVYTGKMTYGGALLIAACITQFNSSLRNLIVDSLFINEDMFLINEFFEFIYRPARCGFRISDEMESICLSNVYYRYKAYADTDSFQLSDVSLEIRKGEKIAIVGKNGAGKSTLIKLILGLYLPASGKISMNGVDYADADIKSVLAKFSYAPQVTTTFPLSFKDNITVSDPQQKDDEMYEKICSKIGLSRLREKLGDDTMMRREIFEGAADVSGGEHQKIKIARALYAQREIIVFDEPMASLDAKAEKRLIDLIFDTYKDKTVIIVTHNLSCTKDCDKIVVVDGGKIRENGNHRELLNKKGLYYNLYAAQASRYGVKENVES